MKPEFMLSLYLQNQETSSPYWSLCVGLHNAECPRVCTRIRGLKGADSKVVMYVLGNAELEAHHSADFTTRFGRPDIQHRQDY